MSILVIIPTLLDSSFSTRKRLVCAVLFTTRRVPLANRTCFESVTVYGIAMELYLKALHIIADETIQSREGQSALDP